MINKRANTAREPKGWKRGWKEPSRLVGQLLEVSGSGSAVVRMRLLNRFVEGGLAGFIGRLLQQCFSRVMEGRIWTVPPAASRPNPNSEGRNPKEGRIPKAEATLGHFGFRVSAFFRPSDFGLRVWAFAHTGWWYCPDTPGRVEQALAP